MVSFEWILLFYKQYVTWKLKQPKNAYFSKPDLMGLKDKMVKVRIEEGGFLIFISTQLQGI